MMRIHSLFCALFQRRELRLAQDFLGLCLGALEHADPAALFPGTPGAAFSQLCNGYLARAEITHGVLLSQEIAVSVHHLGEHIHRQGLFIGGKTLAQALDAAGELVIQHHLG